MNQVLIWIGKDELIKNYLNNWSRTTIDKKKTLQENVGFSHRPEIDEAIQKVHVELKKFGSNLTSSSHRVLDIGCGVGLYLKEFSSNVEKVGTDLSQSFIDKGKQEIPNAELYCADYLELEFSEKFDLVYSISVLEYVPPSKLNTFFSKIYQELKSGGKLFIQYPHAISKRETYYPDLSYIQYSPKVVEKELAHKFEIIDHFHSYDNRRIKGKWDKKIYDPEMGKSFRNGYILLAQKID